MAEACLLFVSSISQVSAAAEYCYETLTNAGGNSWLGMIAQNATMTMESWQQAPFEPQGGGTFSHPWTAAPAYVIPRFLMGTPAQPSPCFNSQWPSLISITFQQRQL